MTSKVISDFKILNNTGKTSLLEVRIVVTGDKVGEGCDYKVVQRGLLFYFLI